MKTIIIGGGASGLACAIRIKNNNPKEEVVVLERLCECGRKLLATGNGRCNLTNQNARYSNDFANEVLNKYSVSKTLEFFESIGLKTVEESEGRIYPSSLQASTVLYILFSTCKKSGVEIICDCKVNSVKDNFAVFTNQGVFKCDKLVVATGGKASKNLGSNGSGYPILQSYGHTITNLSPALVQLTSSSKHCKALKGLRRKCNVSAEVDGEIVKSEYGEVLFADYGISGIVVMNLSCIFSKNKDKKCLAVLDLVPDMSEEEIFNHINQFGNLIGILGIKLNEIIKKQANGNAENMAKFCKNWRLIITGTKGFDFAQVTLGGAKTDEFTNSMESKLQNGLFAIGEVLDVSGQCGGYNLQWAWSSALSAADKIGGIK